MLKEFNEYLRLNCHCSPENRFLIALSGGIDSTVMTWLFHETAVEFSIAHCNFHLRGKESDHDQFFVEKMAGRIQSECFIKHFNTKEFASSNGLSIQMAARNLRYEWFEDLQRKHHFDYIAVGHNSDDIIETVLLNLSRGTGIRGLTGINPRQGYIVRPLLFASRQDILSFAKKKRIKWRNDSSNADTKYHRNAIRHTKIPAFEKIYPAFRQNVLLTTDLLSQAEQLFSLTIENLKKTICIDLPGKFLVDIDKLLEYPAVETILFELLREFGCNQSMIHSLVVSIDGESGKKVVTDTHTVTRDRRYLIVTKNMEHPDEVLTIERGTDRINHPIRLSFRVLKEAGDAFAIPVSKNTAALDLDLITFPLKLRRWQAGDHFRPLGMKGTKKISDYLIDSKIPLPDKENIWLIESNEQIVWLINHRIDDRYKINRSTKNILLIEFTEGSENETA